MVRPFVYNIIPRKSGKRAFDVKISDGNIVRIILYMYIYGPYLRFTLGFLLYTTPVYIHISVLHTTPQNYAYMYTIRTHTPTNTLVKTLNASNGHSLYTIIYILYKCI